MWTLAVWGGWSHADPPVWAQTWPDSTYNDPYSIQCDLWVPSCPCDTCQFSKAHICQKGAPHCDLNSNFSANSAGGPAVAPRWPPQWQHSNTCIWWQQSHYYMLSGGRKSSKSTATGPFFPWVSLRPGTCGGFSVGVHGIKFPVILNVFVRTHKLPEGTEDHCEAPPTRAAHAMTLRLSLSPFSCHNYVCKWYVISFCVLHIFSSVLRMCKRTLPGGWWHIWRHLHIAQSELGSPALWWHHPSAFTTS